MDPAAFDRLTRFVNAVRPRRSLGGLGLGLVGTLLGVEAASAAPCPKSKKKCKKKCIAKKKCCTNANCKPAATHKVCRNGTCVCAPGFKPCGGGCIPTAVCCGGCNPNQNCVNGACAAKRCGAGAPCRVFVTSTGTTGAILGLLGADTKCQLHADVAQLGGTYKAWLSDSTASPSTRFTNTATTGPYQLVNGTQIAANWATLIDGGIDNPINRTELGEFRPDDSVWTKTTTAGTLWADNTTCGDWFVGDNSLSSAGGDTGESDELWTQGFGGLLCSISLPLYCFEQG